MKKNLKKYYLIWYLALLLTKLFSLHLFSFSVLTKKLKNTEKTRLSLKFLQYGNYIIFHVINSCQNFIFSNRNVY